MVNHPNGLSQNWGGKKKGRKLLYTTMSDLVYSTALSKLIRLQKTIYRIVLLI